MTTLERQVYSLWTSGAVRGPYFGSCDCCSRTEDEDGRRLLVARQQRRRQFECFDCFAGRTG